MVRPPCHDHLKKKNLFKRKIKRKLKGNFVFLGILTVKIDG
jgi:hypothetical protein